ncbi:MULTISPECIES: radical SAM protein [Streptomyces]|uniref:radical SAM protein n=1 Tax=Streptomyces TaxID=1883 RepID=UPI000B14D881|nr:MULTISPECIES: radical SAM protein [Streptomyces]
MSEAVRPVPFRQFVLKVHSRCNLACTYCYIYEGPDQSWRERPVRVAERTMHRTAERIAEHVAAHGLRSIRIDLHGGEPLLAGPAALIAYAQTVRNALPDRCSAAVSVQTNGTLLTADILKQLSAAGITVGLSLDGGSARLNRRRIDRAGRSSWPSVRRAAGLLADAPASYGGILCTIDVDTDPGEIYQSLVTLGPPSLDFLLPYGNWSEPPPGIGPFAGPACRAARPVPYGHWLAHVFDLWWDTPSGHPPVQVRLFGEIVALLLGAASRTETVGLSPLAVVVIDTDGSIQRIDSLKTAYAGAPVPASGRPRYAGGAGLPRSRSGIRPFPGRVAISAIGFSTPCARSVPIRNSARCLAPGTLRQCPTGSLLSAGFRAVRSRKRSTSGPRLGMVMWISSGTP